ncbi:MULTISPECIES: DUF192 domain-containing protein [unclassified Achromobacter]|jgi:uncharacterized protein|uniref:DUF192 domain-containing protein n=1 Tax=unclassified Achromobacter TaxID=2626865 RepID=UPI000B515B12|nr:MULTISPECIES: DUF192 domain-containing protein [unclassified Achromobacter]OWT80966.1 hypothetical protein CEY05_06300 [Achromobacter sp. HZ34]OWT81482.1 hypothetical protein CEY04_06290 [Achromobacter sp. HZ28]
MQTSAALPSTRSSFTRGRGAALTALLLAFAATFTAAAGAARAQEPTTAQPPLRTVQLSAGIHVIHAEVANTDATRQRGLMFRKELEANDGMLFVFEAPDMQCFWMHNTPLPLSIAFIADDGTIANIADMAPETDDTHCSKKPVRYALEMAQGWFTDHGISAGKKIDGLP